MEIQVMMPSPAVDFNFDSTTTSPYATPPSSPQRFPSSFFYSAPTSPTHQAFHQHQDDDDDGDGDGDFAFDFSGQLEQPSISSADELFDGGKIKPLKPPPPRPYPAHDPPSLPKSPRNNFSQACDRTPGEQTHSERGRQRRTTATTRHQVSRSLSPLRVSDIITDGDKISTNQSSSSWYNKWNLKNLLLFRSASEGSATTSKDPLKKYGMIKRGDEDVKNWSFRSTDGGGGSVSRRMGRKVSAHEANRAVAEEMRRKTLLPYRSGLLGCLQCVWIMDREGVEIN